MNEPAPAQDDPTASAPAARPRPAAARRSGLLDLAILIAAVAVGFSANRAWFETVRNRARVVTTFIVATPPPAATVAIPVPLPAPVVPPAPPSPSPATPAPGSIVLTPPAPAVAAQGSVTGGTVTITSTTFAKTPAPAPSYSYLLRPQLAFEAAAHLATPVMIGLLLISLRRPRPGLRRLARRPGFVACVAAAAALAINGLEVGFPAVFQPKMAPGVYNPFDPAWEVRIGPSVIGAWSVLALGGRWRPDRGWVDRFGRLLGLFWIAHTAWPRVQADLIPLLPAGWGWWA